MTNVVITKQKNNIVKVVCSGHSGYAEFGKDIVCSALSSIVLTTVLGLTKIVKVNVNLKRDDDAGFIQLELPKNLSDDKLKESQLLLNTMLVGIKDLQLGYSKYIKLEVAE